MILSKGVMLLLNYPQKLIIDVWQGVRHLHLQIGQRYCKKEEKDNWGCKYFIKDFYRSLNPHRYWANGANSVTCFDEKKIRKRLFNLPFRCMKSISKNNYKVNV